MSSAGVQTHLWWVQNEGIYWQQDFERGGAWHLPAGVQWEAEGRPHRERGLCLRAARSEPQDRGVADPDAQDSDRRNNIQTWPDATHGPATRVQRTPTPVSKGVPRSSRPWSEELEQKSKTTFFKFLFGFSACCRLCFELSGRRGREALGTPSQTFFRVS